jgi:NAD(P)H-dependent flavin oxidoreductase YrpB (nitropropane dioxygenase family)
MSPIVCGQGVGLIDEVKTIRRIIDDIVSEADDLLARLNGIAG